MKSVLLADNDPFFLDTRAEFLVNAGYQVIKAMTLPEADRILRERWVHVAVLDIRLENDDDDLDRSGLGLAQQADYAAIPKIIFTNYPTPEAVRLALRKQSGGKSPAIDFVAKKEGPEALIEAVRLAFVEHVQINWDLSVRWSETQPLSFSYLANLIEPGLHSERLSDRAHELEDLCRRLFYEKSQITIERLLWQTQGRIAFTVFTFAPNLPSQPVIVICGLPERIHDEHQRYRMYAPSAIKSSNATLATLSESGETTHFAAYLINGVPLDKSVQTLEAFGHSNPDRRELQLVIDSLGETLAAWHRNERVLSASAPEFYRWRLGLASVSVADFGAQMLALQHEAVAYGLTLRLDSETCYLRFNNDLNLAFPDPRTLLFAEDPEDLSTVPYMIVPGTLAPENVLIHLEENLAWLTDFADVGPAPPLWNFSALEAAFRFDLVECNDLTQLHEMEQRLTSAGALGQLDTQTHVAKAVRPTLRRIDFLRHKAAELTVQAVEAYHRAIFFQSVARVMAFKPGVRLSRSELVRALHALLAAGLIGERILKAPLVATDQLPTLRLESTDQRAWLDERPIHLTPIEFELLAYLASRPGRLCSHEEIIQKVWDPKKDLASLRGALNTTIGRLREKIEPDPARPRYIITDHARGYRLLTHSKS